MYVCIYKKERCTTGFQTKGLWSPSKAATREERLVVFILSSLYWVLYLQAKPGGVGGSSDEGKASIKGSDKNKGEKPAIKKNYQQNHRFERRRPRTLLLRPPC